MIKNNWNAKSGGNYTDAILTYTASRKRSNFGSRPEGSPLLAAIVYYPAREIQTAFESKRN